MVRMLAFKQFAVAGTYFVGLVQAWFVTDACHDILSSAFLEDRITLPLEVARSPQMECPGALEVGRSHLGSSYVFSF